METRTRKTRRTLSVVVPAYNESATIDELLRNIFAVGLPEGFKAEVIVVDDASTDATPEILEAWTGKIRCFRHPQNLGKGAAVKTGLVQSTGDVVVIQDADLEYDPADWARMLAPIVEDKADAVFGSRFVSHQPHRVLYFWHYVGNRLLTSFSNMFTNLNLTDMETCYKMFSRAVVDDIKHRLVSRGFGIEPELVARAKHYRLYEVGVSYHGRTYAQGKKINWKDGAAALWHIIRFNLFSR